MVVLAEGEFGSLLDGIWIGQGFVLQTSGLETSGCLGHVLYEAVADIALLYHWRYIVRKVLRRHMSDEGDDIPSTRYDARAAYASVLPSSSPLKALECNRVRERCGLFSSGRGGRTLRRNAHIRAKGSRSKKNTETFHQWE